MRWFPYFTALKSIKFFKIRTSGVGSLVSKETIGIWTQYAKGILNKIAEAISKSLTGRESMLQGF